ncbi:MAG: hypothetical protein LBH00_00500 [Planctomycetaceae bacterium]|nr:hypothetical protein [Planctomycetaceae bacterium]
MTCFRQRFTIFVCFFAVLNTAYGLQRGDAPIPAMFPPGNLPAGTFRAVGRTAFDAFQNGLGNSMLLLGSLDNAKIREEVGLTDKEADSMRGLRMQLMLKAPIYAAKMKDLKEGDLKTFSDDLAKDLQSVNEQVDKNIAPNRKEKTQKLLFQSLGGLHSPLMNMDTMTPLHLSEEQKKKVQAEFDEMKAERETIVDDYLKLLEKGLTLGKDLPPEERKQLREKLDEERRLLDVQLYETGKKLGDRLRRHLTPEQLEEERILLASRPDFLPPLPKEMQKSAENTYKPNDKSWKPGQGVPNPAAEPERKPFPKTE